jgi:hypothetical protein
MGIRHIKKENMETFYEKVNQMPVSKTELSELISDSSSEYLQKSSLNN